MIFLGQLALIGFGFGAVISLSGVETLTGYMRECVDFGSADTTLNGVQDFLATVPPQCLYEIRMEMTGPLEGDALCDQSFALSDFLKVFPGRSWFGVAHGGVFYIGVTGCFGTTTWELSASKWQWCPQWADFLDSEATTQISTNSSLLRFDTTDFPSPLRPYVNMRLAHGLCEVPVVIRVMSVVDSVWAQVRVPGAGEENAREAEWQVRDWRLLPGVAACEGECDVADGSPVSAANACERRVSEACQFAYTTHLYGHAPKTVLCGTKAPMTIEITSLMPAVSADETAVRGAFVVHFQQPYAPDCIFAAEVVTGRTCDSLQNDPPAPSGTPLIPTGNQSLVLDADALPRAMMYSPNSTLMLRFAVSPSVELCGNAVAAVTYAIEKDFFFSGTTRFQLEAATPGVSSFPRCSALLLCLWIAAEKNVLL